MWPCLVTYNNRLAGRHRLGCIYKLEEGVRQDRRHRKSWRNLIGYPDVGQGSERDFYDDFYMMLLIPFFDIKIAPLFSNSFSSS